MTKTYSIALANTYSATYTPLAVLAGYVNQKSMAYNCITQIPTTDYVAYPFNNDLTIINSNMLQTPTEGSYSIFLYDTTTTNPPIPFSFYVFRKFFNISDEILLQLINRELPAIYSPDNELNNVDNIASAGVIKALYDYIYSLFWNALTSVGTGTGYNSQWETVYIGATNFLQNATYPAQFLRTLMNVNTQTSTQAFSIAQCLSRLIFQFTGVSAPVEVAYDSAGKKYLINIFYEGFSGWILGITGHTELGITTILGDTGSNSFLWIINEVANRLMPAYVKFSIIYLSTTEFDAQFNTSIVDSSDFINPAIIYDAYEVVNNNNVFNTQGYLRN